MNHSAQQCLTSSKGIFTSLLEALRTLVDSKYPKREVNWCNPQASLFGEPCELLGRLYATGQNRPGFSPAQSLSILGVTVKSEMADRTVPLGAILACVGSWLSETVSPQTNISETSGGLPAVRSCL